MLSEDDGPHRRLRPGFADFEDVKKALILLLRLQPGFEVHVLWSVVRHDHFQILQYLILELRRDVETRYIGLTMLQNAILYGRIEIAAFLLARGADPNTCTFSRGLTCLHLIMLVKQDEKTDVELFELLGNASIPVDAQENAKGLTALHMAIRNQRTHMATRLLDMGANVTTAVTDQLHILSQGQSGWLESIATRPVVFGKSLTILGKVLTQFIQDGFYSIEYVTDLICFLFYTRKPPRQDRDNKLTIMHLLAMADAPDDRSRVDPLDWYNDGKSRGPLEPYTTASISLLQLAVQYTDAKYVNYRDIHSDTPLHYACAARKLDNVHTLLRNGADPAIRNDFGLNCVDVLALSVFFLGSKTFYYNQASHYYPPS